MRILFLSDNFPPESNAPATRLHEHAVRWVRAGHEVTVITCAPNFPEGKLYAGYRNAWRQVETVDGIRVVRVKTFITANEGFLRRTLDYMSFMAMAFAMGLFERRPDVVVSTSPQFFCAIAGWALSVAKWRPFVFELRDLWRTYLLGGHEVHALAGVDLTIEEGAYVAIMGPSGSGKSTLLNVLGLLDRPTRGTYRLGGRDVSALDDDDVSAERGRRLGFVFQNYNLIPQLDVVENVEVPMVYAGVPDHEARERARALATRMGLEARLDHRPTELSGGQQQRVAIARALANDPLVLLADEPTGNLDSRTGQEILGLLYELHAQGKTLVVVTHDPGVAARADRIVRMRDGRVERIDVNRPVEARP